LFESIVQTLRQADSHNRPIDLWLVDQI